MLQKFDCSNFSPNLEKVITDLRIHEFKSKKKSQIILRLRIHPIKIVFKNRIYL